MDALPRDPAPCGWHIRGLRVKTCLLSCSCRLHFLRSWSLRPTRCGSEAMEPGACVSAIAHRIGIRPSQLFGWRRDAQSDSDPDHPEPLFARTSVWAAQIRSTKFLHRAPVESRVRF
ncbi:transposase [Agrobacterium tumefaciens]|uniref:transposase n=2 Tax=Rhizobiaceae TaxID=82115 RepID=UPI0009EAF2FD|nr:transposase [Agrobacterium tumefaciens]UXT84659.1 transposase [Agrobacterium tumefaciens]